MCLRRARGSRSAGLSSRPMARIEQRWVVCDPALKSPWIPEVQEVEGKVFLRLQKWDSKFTAFVTAKTFNAHGKRAKNQINMLAFQDLLEQRREACHDKLRARLQEGYAAEQEQNPTGKPLRLRKPREDDQYLAGRIVELQMPQCEDAGWSFGPVVLKVLWGIHTTDLWVEFSLENLKYVRGYLRSYVTDDPPAPKRRKKPQARKAKQPVEEEPPQEPEVDAT